MNAADELFEQRPWRRDFILKIGLAAQHTLVIAADCVQSERPDIGFASNGTLQKANDCRFRFWPMVFDRADERRHVRELGVLCEKSSYFNVWIYAVLELAIKLKEKFVIKEHRRVALLYPQDLRIFAGNGLICFDRFGNHADEFAGSRFHFLATNDRCKKLRARTRVPDGVEQNTFVTAFKTRYDRMRCGLRNRTGSVPGRNFNR